MSTSYSQDLHRIAVAFDGGNLGTYRAPGNFDECILLTERLLLCICDELDDERAGTGTGNEREYATAVSVPPFQVPVGHGVQLY
jgi:hypothetical protein